MQMMECEVAKALGKKAVAIQEAGFYVAPSGRRVVIGAALQSAREGTCEYYAYTPDQYVPPERQLHECARRQGCTITVENATVLAVGRRMAATGPVAALNFASATSPGGGFLYGALAQEETIARSSGLYYCLKDRSMYTRHRRARDHTYSDDVIYSPNVPVFRVDAGDLLEEFWTLSVLTSPAVNGRGIVSRDHSQHRLDEEVPDVMRARTAKVLAVAAKHGARRLILGAWGCGAFGLKSEMMAGLFSDALSGPASPFAGCFDEIVFAVTDWSDDQQFIGPFRRAFAQPTGLPPSPPRTADADAARLAKRPRIAAAAQDLSAADADVKSAREANPRATRAPELGAAAPAAREPLEPLLASHPAQLERLVSALAEFSALPDDALRRLSVAQQQQVAMHASQLAHRLFVAASCARTRREPSVSREPS